MLSTLVFAACGSQTSGTGSQAKFTGTIHIASSTWTGYAPLYLATSKGIWAKHGLNVDFTDVEDPVERLNALKAGRLQGMASTVDAFARAQAQGVPAVEILPIDASVGGDGILAKNTIQSVQDLKGKTVAVNQGSVSEWFLGQVLKRNGMSLSDVTEQNMTSGVAGSTFVAGRVDVAVTWEPWLTRASHTSFGHVLVSSKQYPDLIMDSFAFRKDFISSYPGTVTDFVKAYYEAYNYLQSNPSDAQAVVGTSVKESASDVAGDLSTMTVFGLSDAKTVMGTSSSHGKIYANCQAASDFWKQQGTISSSANCSSAIDPTFINNA
ncbi:MAG TPA: ABC transporter substrate-binding protein [Candidatus Dormibacteraeota bacterium]|nr:ABC transporter substrate-binding protein [Candidatus Dormibacteraeota bacterium]